MIWRITDSSDIKRFSKPQVIILLILYHYPPRRRFTTSIVLSDRISTVVKGLPTMVMAIWNILGIVTQIHEARVNPFQVELANNW